MTEFYIPAPKQFVRLQEQPLFPIEDLSEGNKDVLIHKLKTEAGPTAVGDQLAQHQQYLYMVAMQGLASIGYDSTNHPAGVEAFSRGFAEFETISYLVHKPHIYNGNHAIARVSDFLIDTTPSQPEPEDDMSAELYQLLDEETMTQPKEVAFESENETEVIQLDSKCLEVPKSLAEFLASSRSRQNKLADRDLKVADRLFAERHHIIPEKLPNTYEVLSSVAIARQETQQQIQARLAGASFALALQTTD